VLFMPRRDGTGPLGQGAMTGRGLGLCTNSNNQTYGYGRGFGLSRGNNCRRNTIQTNRNALTEQKKILEARLAEINKQLDK
jgi:hypothetical protein